MTFDFASGLVIGSFIGCFTLGLIVRGFERVRALIVICCLIAFLVFAWAGCSWLIECAVDGVVIWLKG